MFLQAFKYKQWADQRTLDAIQFIDAARFPSSMAFARQQLNHMVRVEELFRARLAGDAEPHQSTNTDVVPELDALALRLGLSNQWFASYAESLPAEHHQQTVAFTFVDGKRGRMTRQEMLFHIVNHGTYHRGAIGHCLDLAEAPRPADTYTVFIHAADPQRRG